SDELARRRIDLHDRTLAHVELDVRIAANVTACPAMQREWVRLTVEEGFREREFAMVAVSSSVRLSVDVGQRLRVAEVVRIAERQVERIREALVGIRNLEGRSQDKILSPTTPVSVRLDFFPATDIVFLTN